MSNLLEAVLAQSQLGTTFQKLWATLRAKGDNVLLLDEEAVTCICILYIRSTIKIYNKIRFSVQSAIESPFVYPKFSPLIELMKSDRRCS